MSKIINDGVIRSGTGCFIAVPVWQQWASKGYTGTRCKLEYLMVCLNWVGISSAVDDVFAACSICNNVSISSTQSSRLTRGTRLSRQLCSRTTLHQELHALTKVHTKPQQLRQTGTEAMLKDASSSILLCSAIPWRGKMLKNNVKYGCVIFRFYVVRCYRCQNYGNTTIGTGYFYCNKLQDDRRHNLTAALFVPPRPHNCQ